jgi:hypothetical protein
MSFMYRSKPTEINNRGLSQKLLYEVIMPPKAAIALPNTAIYNMIRFWGRKPWNIVRKHIEHYTKEGGIVFDPFAGCGVATIEALKTCRRSIYNDLNKFLCFLARTSCKPVDIDKLEEYFKILTKQVLQKKHIVLLDGKSTPIAYDWLYSTTCPADKMPAAIRDVLYVLSYKPTEDKEKLTKLVKIGRKRKIAKLAVSLYKVISKHEQITHPEMVKAAKLKVAPEMYLRAVRVLEDFGLIVNVGETPTLIRYECSNRKCKEREKEPDKEDILKLNEISRMIPTYYYPTDTLCYPSKERFLTKRPGTESVDKLFTKRTLIALSIVRNEIEQLDAEDSIKEALFLCFAAILEHVSKMQRPNKKGWDAKNYIIRPVFLEQNVYQVFKTRFKRIIAGKKESKKEIAPFYKESVDPLNVIDAKANVCFLNADARETLLPEEKVDYVFTDPEYGDSIQYYELSYMASKWLKLETDWKKEIVVNTKQGKPPDVYRDALVEAFKQIYKALKTGKYMTVTFHNREIKYWNALMYAIQIAGFKYVSSVYQTPQKEYTNWLYRQNPGSMSGDIYITFYKPPLKEPLEEAQVDVERVIQNIVLPEAREIILLHGGQATYNQLVRGITLRLINEGLMHKAEIRDLDYVKVFDSHFKRIGKIDIWGLRQDEKVSPIDFIPLDKRIEWIIFSVFNEKGGKILINDALAAIFTTLRNAKTPENEEIVDVLKGLADPKPENGQPYWELRKGIQVTLDEAPTLPPKVPVTLIKEQDEDLNHDRIIRVMCELGKAMGYDVWIGEPEVKKDPDLKAYATISELEISGFDETALRRLKNSDVIWLIRRTIPVAIIEVEHTTDPRLGLMRMVNIFEELPHLNVKTITIIPDRKVRVLDRISEEPSIKRLIGEREVLYSTYSKITELFDTLEQSKPTLEDFIKICQRLVEKSS